MRATWYLRVVHLQKLTITIEREQKCNSGTEHGHFMHRASKLMRRGTAVQVSSLDNAMETLLPAISRASNKKSGSDPEPNSALGFPREYHSSPKQHGGQLQPTEERSIRRYL
jgi:hypothetical protein